MMNMRDVKVLIVEDDPFFCTVLKDLFTLHFPYIHVCSVAESIVQARLFLQENEVDLVFLDIELPDGKGFDLLASMEEMHFEVIITTSHSNYAIDAIRHSALDYLLKPVAYPEMEAAMVKFIKKFQAGSPDLRKMQEEVPVFKKLPLSTSDGFVFVNIDEIIHAEADRAYAVFSMKDGNKIMVSKPLGEFEIRLLKHNFFRIHKSHLINLHEVTRYVRGEGGYVVMSNDEIVPVSRIRKDEFLKIIAR
ncbi:MAG: LytTR family DNA-binding domain-containing protein [Bacteroidetes bacterium]|nr:LytTR family DNA-binding domain-containing protein [Bacteroidota bacterium]